MSDLFRNIVFVLVASGCLLVTFLNHSVTVSNSEVVFETFHSLNVQQAEANQVEAAQTYAASVGQIAFYETFRAASLEVQKDEAAELIAGLGQQLDQMEFQAEMYEFSLEAQGSYIQQLMAFIESKGLESPVPLATAEPTPAGGYHESLLDEDGYPAQ